jgi:TRAP-type C4-dicarboxylate transport system permease small subunit
MLARLRSFSDGLNRAVIAVCIGCLLVMLSISFIGSFYQVITGASLAWTYSLARLFVPWIGMLSITVAFKSGEHVAMTMLMRFLPERAVTIAAYFNLFVIGVFAVLLVWFGWDFFLGSTQYFMVSDQIQVHYRWVVVCIPITGLILLVHLTSGLQLLAHTDVEAEAEALVEAEMGVGRVTTER